MNRYPSTRYAEDVGTLEWDPMNGEGEIRFTQWFMDADSLTQADCLQDWIGLLQRDYDQLMSDDGDFLEDHRIDTDEPTMGELIEAVGKLDTPPWDDPEDPNLEGRN